MDNKKTGGKVFCLVLLLILSSVFSLLFSNHFIEYIVLLPVIFATAILIWRDNSAKTRNIAFQTMNDSSCSWLCFVLYFCIVLFGSLIYWGAYYPGGFNLDAYGQWDQAHKVLPYNDWHPLFSTLIIQFIITLFDSFAFYILVQIISFSASVAYLLKSMQDQGVEYKWLLLLSVFIGINPAIGLNTICLTKDVQFTICLTLLLACLIKIYFSAGEWLRSSWHILFFSILSATALLVRHNGLFFVATALLLLFLYYKNRWVQNLIVTLLIVAFVLILKGPVSQKLQVERHENVIGESIGIPMSILVNALVSDPENIPIEAHQFLNEIASDEEWISRYVVGEWDSCKWDFGGTQLLKGESLRHILNLTWKTIRSCPQASYESFRINTQLVWNPLMPNPDWAPDVSIAENDSGIVSQSVPFLHRITEPLKRVSLTPIVGAVFWNTGFHMALLLIVYCAVFYRVDRRIRFLFLPLLIYDIGTMLLLAGPNQRYFFCNAVAFFPILMILLLQKSTSESN